MTIETAIPTPAALEAVGRGLNWLNTAGRRLGLDPDLIEVSTLSVESMSGCCPLSQAAGGRSYVEATHIVSRSESLPSDWFREHGFSYCYPGCCDVCSAEDLDAAWRKLLVDDRLRRFGMTPNPAPEPVLVAS